MPYTLARLGHHEIVAEFHVENLCVAKLGPDVAAVDTSHSCRPANFCTIAIIQHEPQSDDFSDLQVVIFFGVKLDAAEREIRDIHEVVHIGGRLQECAGEVGFLALELAGFREKFVDVIDTTAITLDTNDIIVFFKLFDIDKTGELAIGTGENGLVLFVEIDFVERHFFCSVLATLCLRCHGVALYNVVFMVWGRKIP